jgi:hypothetical protein
MSAIKRELDRKRDIVDSIIFGMLGSDADLASKWWESPNKAFGMETPEKQWEIDPQSVMDYVLDMWNRLNGGGS